MLRDKSLIPLSHQHQRALALCVRIDRASPIDESGLGAWQAEIGQIFQNEIGIHFAAEEHVVFPAARAFAELTPLVDELCADHAWLREHFAVTTGERAPASDLNLLAQRLSAHIRKEERQLFQRMQELMDPDALAVLGRKLDEALKNSTQACVVPTEATRLRAAK
jgi:iron-sulfur cluster repair protein YtfE (RIC family)